MIEKQIKDVIYENRKKKQLTQEQLANLKKKITKNICYLLFYLFFSIIS